MNQIRNNKWIQTFNGLPIMKDIITFKPVFWLNPKKKQMTDVRTLPIDQSSIYEAEERWRRFSPFLKKAFPETIPTNGIIESPLKPIPLTKEKIEHYYKQSIDGKFYLKCDNELPIAGSIKARGGIYEVLKHAESLAIENDLIRTDENYVKFANETFKQFFSQYSISVGSTGNLGLSIGMISAKLGFQVKVHMSADAKQWKKDLLRKKGVQVYEYKGDFSEAIKEGRKASQKAEKSYFVDDEDSKDLFLGYSVAALRLKEQLREKKIEVNNEHPLFVYLPCGVGGSPGGITFGLKHVFGDHVHCFFVEPTHSPSVLLGLLTGKYEQVSVQDFGIDNRTEADGLAVGRPSRFATRISEKLVSGIYTIEDDELFRLLAMLVDGEGILVEPSAASGVQGPVRLVQSNYLNLNGLSQAMAHATHIAWSTGGALVPNEDMEQFYKKGKHLL